MKSPDLPEGDGFFQLNFLWVDVGDELLALSYSSPLGTSSEAGNVWLGLGGGHGGKFYKAIDQFCNMIKSDELQMLEVIVSSWKYSV